MTISLSPTTHESGSWVHVGNEDLVILRTEDSCVTAINPADVHHVRSFDSNLITAALANARPAWTVENQPRESVLSLVAPSLTLDTFTPTERAQMPGLWVENVDGELFVLLAFGKTLKTRVVCVRAGKELTVQPITELFLRLDLGRAWTENGEPIPE